MKMKNITIDLGNPVHQVLGFVCTFGWIAGVVIADGFWSTLFALNPLWAWYLSVEKILQSVGAV